MPHGLRFSLYTVKVRTAEKFAVSTLKFEQGGFTIELYVQKMQTDWRTVYTLIRLLRKQALYGTYISSTKTTKP